jgi:hypothetical protein
MTDELDLDAIEALANAATPGPWEVDYDERVGGADQILRGNLTICFMSSPRREYNAEFIAAARAAVPALVAEVRRLRAAVAAAKGEADEYHYIVRPIQSPAQDFSDVFTCGYDVRVLKLTDKARKLVRPPKLPDEAGHA